MSAQQIVDAVKQAAGSQRALRIAGGGSKAFYGHAMEGEVLDTIDSAVKEELPKGQATDLDGESREFRETGSQLGITLLLALIFIYLVLSAQFESFAGPLVIMFTVPLAMSGAVLAMWINAKIGIPIRLIGRTMGNYRATTTRAQDCDWRSAANDEYERSRQRNYVCNSVGLPMGHDTA